MTRFPHRQSEAANPSGWELLGPVIGATDGRGQSDPVPLPTSSACSGRPPTRYVVNRDRSEVGGGRSVEVDDARCNGIGVEVDDAERGGPRRHLRCVGDLRQLDARGRRREHREAVAVDGVIQVDVAADEKTDVAVGGEACRQVVAVAEGHGVDPGVIDGPGVVVDEGDRGGGAVGGEVVLEPGELLRIEEAGSVAGVERVEDDELVACDVEAAVVGEAAAVAAARTVKLNSPESVSPSSASVVLPATL